MSATTHHQAHQGTSPAEETTRHDPNHRAAGWVSAPDDAGPEAASALVAPLRRVAEPFTAVVASLSDENWRASSPCAGWTARDVLDHVMGTQRDFLAGHGLDCGAATDPQRHPAEAWQGHLNMVLRVLDEHSVWDRTYAGYFGPTTIGQTMVAFYGFDLIVHRWDLAAAGGRSERFTPAELNELQDGIASFGSGLYQEGICKPALAVAADADLQTRVLAALGRHSSLA